MNPIAIVIFVSIATTVVFFIGTTVGRWKCKQELEDKVDNKTIEYSVAISKLTTCDEDQRDFAMNIVKHFKNNILYN
jgi:hypothetical protein